MLAGCSSSSLLSPRHNRLRSEESAQFQPCHYSSMSTQRLDLPCTFTQKPTSRQPPVRPVGLSVDTPIEARTSGCSIQHNIRLPNPATNTTTRDSLKRFAEQSTVEVETGINRAKRKKGNQDSGDEDLFIGSLGQLGSEKFWFQDPGSSPLFSRLNHPQSPLSVPSGTGEKNAEPSEGQPTKEPSGSSSTSSESQRLGLRLIQDITQHDSGNGSRPPNPNGSRGVAVASGQVSREEHDGFELISFLVDCVDSISSKNIAGINHFIAKLGELASPKGGSSISRLVAYFTEALAIRVARIWPHIFHINLPREFSQIADEDSGSALRLLNQVSPIPKFIHFTSNEIILRSFEGKDRVHIIDFDVKQGLQWPSLFQSLASRPNPPSHVRITGIGESKQELIETGERLSGFADALNIPFEFHPVVDRLEDVRLWMLHVKENETVAVNCIFQLHKMLYDATGGVLQDFLGLIKSTNPEIVVMAEQEADHNEAGLEARLTNSLNYYSALFDSLDSVLPLNSSVRVNIEEMFGCEIRNIVACEGRDRFSRHVKFEEWRRLMEGGGFRCIGISEREFIQSKMVLKMYSSENYKVAKIGSGASGLMLSWLDQPLYMVSAWGSMDLAGGSSG